MAVGASATSSRTTASSHSPAPAASVSRTWFSRESDGSRTAANPPWAQAVDPEASVPFVTTRALRTGRTAKAAASPAAPEPTMTTSTSRSQVASGAASCAGILIIAAAPLFGRWRRRADGDHPLHRGAGTIGDVRWYVDLVDTIPH